MTRRASPSGRPDDGRWAGLASELAPELLDEVIEESRAEAAAILRAGLTDALVEAVQRLVDAQEGAPAPHEPVDERAPVAAADRSDAGWYVYGVTWSSAPLPEFTGVDGGRMESIVVDDLAAVVSSVEGRPSWGFGSDGEIDLDALAPRAQQHERVLERMLDNGAILPFRFGVMYPALTDVVSFLRDDAVALRSALRRLDGMEEWGLVIEWQRMPPGRQGSSNAGAPGGGPGAGQDYLVRRLHQQAVDQDSRRRAHRAAQSVHEELTSIAASSVVHAASSSRSEGAHGRNRLLKASYLLPRDRVEDFRSAAERALTNTDTDLGVSGDLSGPWPPYNFSELVKEPAE